MSVCVFRPARETDRETVLALTRDSQGGALTDALWEALLADEAGELSVGELDGQLVAVGKMNVVGTREGWLTFQQISPAHRQQGLTLALTSYQSDRAQKVELRVLRWAVGSANTAAQRVASKLGFHRVAVWGLYVAEPFGEGAPDLAILDERHYSQIQNWLGKSSIFRASGNLLATGGYWQELTGKTMHSLLAARQVAGLTGGNGALDAFAILTGAAVLPGMQVSNAFQVGYVDGEWKSLHRLALALRGHAARASQDHVVVMLIGEPTLRCTFQTAGFQEETDGRDLWIYERLLA